MNCIIVVLVWILASLIPRLGMMETQAAESTVPVIYCTDLFHPCDFPDDHFDLASLYAIREIDIRAIILDQGRKQEEKSGRIPVEQLNHLTGREVPWAIGLSQKLRSPDDKATEEPDKYQRGVEMILETLRNAQTPVTIIAVGSVRDIAAAFNRAPDLFKRKVGMLMISLGDASVGSDEYNVRLDPNAFVRLMNSGLPVYWVPCFDGGLWKNRGNASFWETTNADLLQDASDPVLNFFTYALQRTNEEDHLGPLDRKVPEEERRELFAGERKLWGTVVFTYAAGRNFVRRGDQWISVPQDALKPGDSVADVFTFSPVSLVADRDGRVSYEDSPRAHEVNRFQVLDKEAYQQAMTSATRHLMQELGKQVADVKRKKTPPNQTLQSTK